MFVASNHNQFNDALNRVAGTNGVVYSQPWDMSTNSGRTYMNRAYDAVGRIFADARLASDTLPSSKLCDGLESLTPMQKASLSAVKSSTDTREFDSAVHTAVKYGAINHAAAAVFSRPTGVRARRTAALPSTNLSTLPRFQEAHVAATPHSAPAAHIMEVDAVPTDLADPRPVLLADHTAGGNAHVAPRERKRRKNTAKK